MRKGAALLCVLLAARALMLVGHEAALVSGWDGVLLGVLSDVAVAAAFAAVDGLLGRPRWTWAIYAVLAAVAALDVEVARALGTPVTPVMLAGARGALADSFPQYLTPAAAGRMLVLALVAARAPRALQRARLPAVRPALAAAVCCGLAFVVAGTPALHRNAVTALVRLPAPPTAAAATGLRDGSPAPRDDLRHLRGVAAGRNVLVVVLESTGAAPLGLHGAPGIDPMPRLTALGARGIVFDAAYTAFPESIRELAAYWDSWHPRAGVPAADMTVPAATPLPALLAAGGYRTALFHSGHFDYLGMDHLVRGRGFQVLRDASDVDAARATSFGADEEATVASLLGWIDGLGADERFLAAYLPIAGHHPYDTPRPGPFPAATVESQYRNALRYADDALGMLLDGLSARGRLRDTLVVVTGDHGEAFGEHPGNHGHTFHLYEENVHVPLVIALPGRDSVATRISRVASHVDLAPTITDLLGLPAAPGWEGASLLDPIDRPALFATDWAEHLVGRREGTRKTIRSLDTGAVEIYDLATDPGEQHPLPR